VDPRLREAPAPEPHAIERLLEEAHTGARALWPALEVSAAAFAEHVGKRLRAWEDLPALHFGDLYLAAALLAGDRGALDVFERQYLAELRPGILRLGMTPEAAGELAQQLRVALFLPRPGRPPEISDYSGRGSLRGWLRVMAARSARHTLKTGRRRAFRDEGALLEALDPREDPAMAVMKAVHREQCAEAVRTALEALSTRERTLLRHHLLDGLSIDEIGARYGVHRATAARWVAAARDRLGAEARRVLAARFALDRRAVDSLIHFVQSRVEISFDRLLGDDDQDG